ncbi:MAG: thioredoxin domain-containing protein [Candidatus Aenigmarchaeota archaeon]|nr:thioredoxin domain-containing protein [Candidatus Aenigmarchaeota archaeon]
MKKLIVYLFTAFCFILLINSVSGLTISEKTAGTRELNDPTIGNRNAPITMTWYVDYQGPFDARFYLNTFPLIEKEYIKTGKVKIIVKDFPLSFHINSKQASRAANCANEQGVYKEYITKIFESREKWIDSRNVDSEFESLYKEVTQRNLDTFKRCLKSSKYNSEIDSDIGEGNKQGVSGVPTFFLTRGDKTVQIIGAQPFVKFEEEIESLS